MTTRDTAPTSGHPAVTQACKDKQTQPPQTVPKCRDRTLRTVAA